MLVWNGRLDNRADLARELQLSKESPDVDMVVAAYRRWGNDAFRRLRGDWSIAAWNGRERRLVLAKDPLGMRPLYYAATTGGLEFSGSLDWMVRTVKQNLELDLEYVAGWLSFFPAAHLTPYRGIASVPPASYLCFEPGRTTVHKYWEFEAPRFAPAASDAELEERFRSEFRQAVRRRLAGPRPLLAELSGGVDSSSIVCVADELLAQESGLAPRLDTLSYFDDSEPNWNERPYFSLIEAKRGREGSHIEVGSARELSVLLEPSGVFAATPSHLAQGAAARKRVAQLACSGGYGAILSGVGGDEFTGGVPTPIPELADRLASLDFRDFGARLRAWALVERRPWMHLVRDTVRAFAPRMVSGTPSSRRPPAWLLKTFERRYRLALRGYEKPLALRGPAPSFQENLSTIDALRRQIAASAADEEGTPEKRYPFLDVDFLQFLFGLPRVKLLEPGRRRALMRRAMRGIVPDEILDRKRKAFVTRSPRTAIATLWREIERLTHNMASESLGIVSSTRFREALGAVRAGQDVGILPIYRTLLVECWLQNLAARPVPVRPRPPDSTNRPALDRHRFSGNVSAG